MDRVRCGVIGSGWWATYAHIPALIANAKAELVAIQNDEPVQADRIAKDFRVPNACLTIDELLAIDGLQAVVISSPPCFHYEQAIAALASGMHVLVEKPMTITLAEAMELDELATQRKLTLLISCPWHYTTHATKARALIRERALGEIRMISVLMTNPISHLLRGSSCEPTYGEPYMQPRTTTYADPAIAGGGQIYAQVSHVAAYLAFLMGSRPQKVFARFENDGADVDVYDTLNIQWKNGALTSIASTGATSLGQRDYEVRIFGTKGMLFMDLWAGKMEFVPIVGARLSIPDLGPNEIYPHFAPTEDLIDTVLGHAQDRASAQFGTSAMAVIEAACRSAESGKDLDAESLMRHPASIAL